MDVLNQVKKLDPALLQKAIDALERIRIPEVPKEVRKARALLRMIRREILRE